MTEAELGKIVDEAVQDAILRLHRVMARGRIDLLGNCADRWQPARCSQSAATTSCGSASNERKAVRHSTSSTNHRLAVTLGCGGGRGGCSVPWTMRQLVRLTELPVLAIRSVVCDPLFFVNKSCARGSPAREQERLSAAWRRTGAFWLFWE